MAAVPLPKNEYGKFNDGDAYLVLKTTQPKNKLVWDLFFWLGAESTADEQGVAAYKAVELDDLLGGAPVQHREEQGKESPEFLQCFKKLEYVHGEPSPPARNDGRPQDALPHCALLLTESTSLPDRWHQLGLQAR
eukprot:scaffold111237_cov28-Tisochrysis_lutea.AAC.1